MSVFGVLNRAYHNTKQSIPQDHGWAYDPFGKYIPTTYQSYARISRATKSPGRSVLIELENEVFPEQDPAREGASSSPIGATDTCYITGTQNFNGEHGIVRLDGTPRDPKLWIITDTVNDANTNTDDIVETDVGWVYFAPTSKGDLLVDPLRLISHPGFMQREGQGILTYPSNPDITRNFIYHPAVKVDGVIQRTLSSNVFIQRSQLDEDIVITEIWLGGDKVLSTFSSMFRALYAYWTTIPALGESMAWEPRDVTSDRFLIQIIRVQLGGIDFEYKEVREHVRRNQDTMLDRQLTFQFKLSRRIRPPLPQISLEGL